MADLKISALTSATTPLAGTEVLPVVQSSTTKKTAVSTIKDYILGLANTFTADQTISTGATLTYLNIDNTAGSGNRYSAIALKDNATQKALFYQNHNDGNLLLRNDTAGGSIGLYTQTATYGSYLTSAGNHVISDGNLVIGTSGKGIDFSATSGTGTSELLSDYEEGTFSPTLLTGGTNFTSVTYHPDNAAEYVKIGSCVYVTGVIRTSSITVGSASGNLFIGGLPFSASATYLGGGFSGTQASGWTTYNPSAAQVTPGGTTAGLFYWSTVNGSSTNMPFGNANTALGNNFAFFGYYFV